VPHEGEVESIERAIVAAVAPPRVQELRGWIAAFDEGTVGRARSAAPLTHVDVDGAAVAPICELYRDEKLAPMFRVPRAPRMGHVETQLQVQGLHPEQRTDVRIARADAVAAGIDAARVQIASRPDEAWPSVFLGEGFDPVDGASRVRTLTRAPGSMFASIRESDRVVAAGVLALGHGWASIHGMRTALAHRGQGLAREILAALARAAMARGVDRIMLQVEEANEPAQKLYARRGFERLWTYQYWRERR